MTKNKKIRYENFKLIYREFLKVYPIELTDLDGEIWKDIEDYDGDYQVNNFGRIKSFKNGKVKIRKPYIDKDGYLQIVLSKNGVNKWFKIHRLVAEAFVPNLENKPDIDHIFNNKFDNFAENLRWVTKLENNRYAYETGRVKTGEDNYQAKLTNEQALWCKLVYKPRDKEFSARALAGKFGVNAITMCDVVRNETYKKVCPKAEVMDGLAIHGAEAAQSAAQVELWLKGKV